MSKNSLVDFKEFAQQELDKGPHTLLIFEGKKILFSSNEKGIKPLLDSLETLGENLENLDIADKVMGRAAALISVHAGFQRIYAGLISAAAKSVLKQNECDYIFNDETPYIKDKTGKGWCPMEDLTMCIADPTEALQKVREYWKR